MQLAVRQTQSRGLMMETRRWTGHLVPDIAGAPRRCPVVELMVRSQGNICLACSRIWVASLASYHHIFLLPPPLLPLFHVLIFLSWLSQFINCDFLIQRRYKKKYLPSAGHVPTLWPFLVTCCAPEGRSASAFTFLQDLSLPDKHHRSSLPS